MHVRLQDVPSLCQLRRRFLHCQTTMLLADCQLNDYGAELIRADIELILHLQ